MELKNICKSYDNKAVLQNVNLHFADNEIVAIVGQSGVGKTTLLNIIAGLTTYEGKIANCDSVSYMMQDDVFLDNLSVLDNLRLFTRKTKKEVLSFLGALKLDSVANDLPANLSGGMQRRISFLRALHFDAQVLLFDEPFKSLDAVTSAECVAYLKEFLQNNPRLCLIVSHNLSELAPLSPRVLRCANATLLPC